MSGISTHVLDLTRGTPASGIVVRLSRWTEGVWSEIAVVATDDDGRAGNLGGEGLAQRGGRYRLHFETGEYFRGFGVSCFHPYIEIIFDVVDGAKSYHVPLLLTPYGYSTYRGS